MKYVLLNYFDEKVWAALGDAEQQRIRNERLPLVNELLANGKFLGGAPLEPTSNATTVRVQEGKRLVTDGPFAETREQLAGYALIEAKDLDEAVTIATRILGPSSLSTIEIRPVLQSNGVPMHRAEIPKIAPKSEKTLNVSIP